MNHRNRSFIRKPFSYSYTRITLGIIFINFLIFFACHVSPTLLYYCYGYGPLNVVTVVDYHCYWQFLTYMFLHGNISHLFFNMLGLLVFGLQLERAIGSKEFLLFYLVCGILSGLFSFVVYYFTGQFRATLIGASGAIYAVLFAYAVFFPRSIIMVWGLIPVPAPIMVLIYAIIELGSQFMGSSNIAHMTHLFGFFGAWIYFVARMGIHPLKIWKDIFRR